MKFFRRFFFARCHRMAASPATLSDLLHAQTLARPDAVALIEGDTAISYAALQDSALRVAAALSDIGVRPYDRIAYLGKNSLAYFQLLLGAAYSGAVMVPLGWRLSSAEIAEMVADARAVVLFVESEFAPLVAALSIRRIEIQSGGNALVPWLADIAARDPLRAGNPDEAVVQLYTSGTTGRPKGVMLSHANLLVPRAANRAAGVVWDQWSDRDTSLVSMPIAHISGTGWALYSLYAGARGVIVRDFNPPAVLATIESERISRMFIVPTALGMLADAAAAAPEPGDYRSLRCILYGGSPIDAPTLAKARAQFSCGFVQLYGMTESSGAATALAPDDHHDPARLASAGRALPGTEIAIFDSAGRPVERGQLGEVAIRGPGVMLGYWQQTEATAATIDAAGWLHTGDVGDIDAAGYLTIRDRIKDMIISGGENIYAREVEIALADHPGCAEVAVIGTSHPRWGEAVTAVIVPHPGWSLNEAVLAEWVQPRLARYKVPQRVIVVEALPRNASGKVLKRVLRDEHR